MLQLLHGAEPDIHMPIAANTHICHIGQVDKINPAHQILFLKRGEQHRQLSQAFITAHVQPFADLDIVNRDAGNDRYPAQLVKAHLFKQLAAGIHIIVRRAAAHSRRRYGVLDMENHFVRRFLLHLDAVQIRIFVIEPVPDGTLGQQKQVVPLFNGRCFQQLRTGVARTPFNGNRVYLKK